MRVSKRWGGAGDEGGGVENEDEAVLLEGLPAGDATYGGIGGDGGGAGSGIAGGGEEGDGFELRCWCAVSGISYVVYGEQCAYHAARRCSQ